jgi:hypothetical protein
MTDKTESETLFETFCERHSLTWEPVSVGPNRTPDYRLTFGTTTIIVEIKQIQSEVGFKPNGVNSRMVGKHIRHKIDEARKQLQADSHAGSPTILLVYNAVDPMQLYGTEPHDFVSAMYGDWTVRLEDGHVKDSYHGRNSRLREDRNTSFSAVGHLSGHESESHVRVFENAYARHPLPYEALPRCIKVVRILLENE